MANRVFAVINGLQIQTDGISDEIDTGFWEGVAIAIPAATEGGALLLRAAIKSGGPYYDVVDAGGDFAVDFGSTGNDELIVFSDIVKKLPRYLKVVTVTSQSTPNTATQTSARDITVVLSNTDTI